MGMCSGYPGRLVVIRAPDYHVYLAIGVTWSVIHEHQAT